MTDNDLRSAADVVTSLLRNCLAEPHNLKAQQALIVAVKHFNLQGIAFKLTRECVLVRRQAQLAHKSLDITNRNGDNNVNQSIAS